MIHSISLVLIFSLISLNFYQKNLKAQEEIQTSIPINKKINQKIEVIYNSNPPSPRISDIDEIAQINDLLKKIFDFPAVQIPLLLIAFFTVLVLTLKKKFPLILAIPIGSGLLTLLFLFFFMQIKNIGYNYGYQPDQPIQFSHNLHVKKNKMACAYCHVSAEKSKHATIPTANLCMNCHSVIRTESAEIQKIYHAIKENKPIQWVKVHNLPDYVYFNHSQHVKVGGSVILGKKVETSDDVKAVCQTCHGKVESMDLATQASSLSMGWCLECHKKTPSPSNPEKTVAQRGGNNCYRCHY